MSRTVAVPGGDLAVEVTPGDTEPVLAVHGVSSNARLWNWLNAVAPEISLIAPDLRGRGGSFDVEGPSSLARHAETSSRYSTRSAWTASSCAGCRWAASSR